MIHNYDLAFPVFDSEGDTLNLGLTKREYFACQAMTGFLSSCKDNKYPTNIDYNWLAKESVKYADALISELNKEVKK